MYEQVQFDQVDPATAFNDPVRDVVVGVYVCPSWPDEAVITAGTPSQIGAIVTYAGVGGAISNPSVTLVGGEYPDNGAFALEQRAPGEIVGHQRADREITDGQSQTLAIGEFVHRDCPIGQPCDEPPGNVRPWYISGFQSGIGKVPLVYSFKELEYTPNTQGLTRSLHGWNRMPMGSYHPGAAHFAFVDGSVHLLTDDVDADVYHALATVNGEEIAHAQ